MAIRILLFKDNTNKKIDFCETYFKQVILNALLRVIY